MSSAAATDWLAWHDGYADAGSSLARRLDVVRRRIGEALDASARRPVRVLSLCAGDGRDVLPELVARPSLPVSVVLIELDFQLADAARRHAACVEVRQADAGDWASFADALPVDVLLLCGIFGNVSTGDIRATIESVPSMLARDGVVVWTRGWFRHEDLRPQIRQWFVDAGLEEIAFDGDPERFGVGVARVGTTSNDRPTAGRLFRFIR